MAVDLGFALFLWQQFKFCLQVSPRPSVKVGPAKQVWYQTPWNRNLIQEGSIKAVSTTS